jgi:hypothetical protein
MAKKRKRNHPAKESVIALPERLALTTLIDPTSLLGGADPLGGAMNNLGSLTSQAQQTGPGATAQNIGSDGATSSAVAPPTKP